MDELAVALFALVLAGVAFVLTIVLPIASFVRARQARNAANDLDTRLDGLETTVRRIEAELRAGTGVGARRTDVLAGPALGPSAPPQVPSPVTRPAALPEAAPPAVASADESVPHEPEQLPVATETFESRIGGRGLLYVGAVALLLGVGFFVKYAFDNEWVTETARVVLGGVAGLVLVTAGWQFVRRGYPQYGQILAGTGIVALYIATFAAISFYGLISQGAAFGLMVLITAASALMADRLASHGLAVVALLGGFATPFLVGGSDDAQVTLLTYDAILVAGAIYLARRRGWPYLTLFAYVLTAGTFFAWADADYAPAKYVTTQVFLVVFGALFLYAWYALRRLLRSTDGTNAANKETIDIISFFLSSAPIAVHVASLVNLEAHPLSYLVYLLLVTLAGVVAGIRLERPWLRLVIFAAVVPFLIEWIVAHRTPGWLAASAIGLLAVYLLHLGGGWEWRTRHREAPLTKADVILFHANGLALAGAIYALTWDWSLAWTVGLSLAQAAWHAALAWLTRRWRQEVSPNALALMFALLGLAVGLAWDGWPSIVAWMVEGAAIVWVGWRTRQAWMRAGGIALTAWMLLMTGFNGLFATPAGFIMLWNPRVGAVAAIIAVLYGVAALYRRASFELPEEAPGMRAAYLVAANVMTVLLASVEINSYWHARVGIDAAADLALQASLSLLWALYGTGLIVAGIIRRYRPIRYLAIALLSITILKVFLSDLYQLGGIYRIAGFLGLGVFLLLGAWLYQRYRGIIVGEE